MDENEFEELKARFEAARKKRGYEYFDVDDLTDLIDWYIFDERDDDAAAAIEYALHLYPNNVDVHLLKARLCLCANDFDGASAIMQSISNTCDSPDYSLIMGELLLRDGQVDEAQMRYERAVIVSGDSPESYASAINAFSTYDQLPIAEQWMKRALQRWPEETAVIEASSLCCSLLGRHEDAIAYANKMVDSDPYSIRAWGLLGDVYHDAGNYDDALDAYGYLLAIRPDYTHIDQNIADCHYAHGEWAAARELYARALMQNHADVDYAIGRLALCEANLGNEEEFLRLAQKLRNNDFE